MKLPNFNTSKAKFNFGKIMRADKVKKAKGIGPSSTNFLSKMYLKHNRPAKINN